MGRFLLFLLFTQAVAQESELQCTDKTSVEPPFYITEGYMQGENVYENFRDHPNRKKATKTMAIPRLSLVKSDNPLFVNCDSLTKREPAKKKNEYVRVEVLKTHTTVLLDSLQNSKANRMGAYAGSSKWKKEVQEGDKGYISSLALNCLDNYHFIVNRDSTLFDSEELKAFQGETIKIKKEGEEYATSECCREGKCFEYYIFEAVISGRELFYHGNKCDFSHELFPVLPEHAMPFEKISDILRHEKAGFQLEEIAYFHNKVHPKSMIQSYYARNPKKFEALPQREQEHLNKMFDLETRGLIQIPQYDDGTWPFHSFHYNSDDPGQSDTYAQPVSACAFLQLLKKWNEKCDYKKDKSCQLQWGNFYHKKTWGDHASHYDGACVDIRPFKKAQFNDRDFGLTFQKYSIHDPDKTNALLKLLNEMGAEPIYVNYEYWKNGKKYNFKWVDEETATLQNLIDDNEHEDHIHVCFPSESFAMRKSCLTGFFNRAKMLKIEPRPIKYIPLELPKPKLKEIKPIVLPKKLPE